MLLRPILEQLLAHLGCWEGPHRFGFRGFRVQGFGFRGFRVQGFEGSGFRGFRV